jgi:hypothetical protein
MKTFKIIVDQDYNSIVIYHTSNGNFKNHINFVRIQVENESFF